MKRWLYFCVALLPATAAFPREREKLPSLEESLGAISSRMNALLGEARRIQENVQNAEDLLPLESYPVAHRIFLDPHHNQAWYTGITFEVRGKKVHVSGTFSHDELKHKAGAEDLFLTFTAEGEPLEPGKNPVFANSLKLMDAQTKMLFGIYFQIKVDVPTWEGVKYKTGVNPDLKKIDLIVQPADSSSSDAQALKCEKGKRNCTFQDVLLAMQVRCPKFTLSLRDVTREFSLFYLDDIIEDASGEVGPETMGKTRALVLLPIQENPDLDKMVRLNLSRSWNPGQPWPDSSHMLMINLGPFKNKKGKANLVFGFHVTADNILQIHQIFPAHRS